MKLIVWLFLLPVLLFSQNSWGMNHLAVEGGLFWQSKNDQRIPGNTGTLFSIRDFDKGSFVSFRAYAGKIFNKKHQIRILYAPLEIKTLGQFKDPINFRGKNFAKNTNTSIFYKFNSYRLGYAYHLEKMGNWRLAWGVTGKIRDAEVRLTQGELQEAKKNIGFVPLLNFQALRDISENLRFRFDFEGLAAPQGRAIDAAIFLEHSFAQKGVSLFGGYRSFEGGADNDEVYNFAWFHNVVIGIRAEF